MLALRRLRPRTASLAPRVSSARTIWGVAPESGDSLLIPLDVDSPVPMTDGATPTKVRCREEEWSLLLRQNAACARLSASLERHLAASSVSVRHFDGAKSPRHVRLSTPLSLRHG